MNQKLAKELRRLANQLTDDHTLRTLPQRQWGQNSVVASYRRFKNVITQTPRPYRSAKIAQIRKLVT